MNRQRLRGIVYQVIDEDQLIALADEGRDVGVPVHQLLALLRQVVQLGQQLRTVDPNGAQTSQNVPEVRKEALTDDQILSGQLRLGGFRNTAKIFPALLRFGSSSVLGKEGLERQRPGVLHLLLLALALLVLDDAAPAAAVGVGMRRRSRGNPGVVHASDPGGRKFEKSAIQTGEFGPKEPE